MAGESDSASETRDEKDLRADCGSFQNLLAVFTERLSGQDTPDGVFSDTAASMRRKWQNASRVAVPALCGEGPYAADVTGSAAGRRYDISCMRRLFAIDTERDAQRRYAAAERAAGRPYPKSVTEAFARLGEGERQLGKECPFLFGAFRRMVYVSALVPDADTSHTADAGELRTLSQ